MAEITLKERTNDALNKCDFEDWFVTWFHKNWDLWCIFNEESLKMVNTGKKNYSAYTIIEVIRWNFDVATNGDDKFKINNNVIPRLARLFREVNPQHSKFFTIKPSSYLD